MTIGSSVTGRPVALPLSSWSRQTKPVLRSARRLMTSSHATKSAIRESSMGATMRATFSWAS